VTRAFFKLITSVCRERLVPARQKPRKNAVIKSEHGASTDWCWHEFFEFADEVASTIQHFQGSHQKQITVSRIIEDESSQDNPVGRNHYGLGRSRSRCPWESRHHGEVTPYSPVGIRNLVGATP